MKYRHKVKRSSDRKRFSNTAKKSKGINFKGAPMRGGIRL